MKQAGRVYLGCVQISGFFSLFQTWRTSNHCCDVLNYGQKKRGVYGNLNGFLGGIHLAILAAFVCQNHPNAGIRTLVSIFFSTLATWPWPTPIVLQGGMPLTARDFIESRSFLPIGLPCGPPDYCHSNITKSTFYKIRTEFLRGHALTKDLLKPDFDWNSFFEPFPYSKKYARFVKNYLSAPDQDKLGVWLGWVKSRIRCLILKLEGLQGSCDPSAMEYVDTEVSEPNIVFYWGLNPSRSSFIDIESVEVDFLSIWRIPWCSWKDGTINCACI